MKKYNYDLIQYVTGRVTNYAVCSLNCLPKPSAYILSLKDSVTPISSASQLTKVRKTVQPNVEVVPVIQSTVTVPTITSVVGNANQGTVPNGQVSVNGHTQDGSVSNVTSVNVNGDGSYDYGKISIIF